MQRLGILSIVTLAAACAAPRSEPLRRPRVVAAPPAPAVRPPRLPQPITQELLVVTPAPLTDDPVVPPSTIVAALPAAPVATPLIRPRSGGEALRLADRALEQGDHLDAAAQYRAVLATAPAMDAPYTQLQLARALLRLDQRDAATALLWNVASSRRPEAWPALLLLADLRASQQGVARSLAELRSVAGAQATLLEAHLVHLAPPDEAATILLSMADRTRSQAVACGYTLAAVERIGLERLPLQVRLGRCRAEIDGFLGEVFEPSPFEQALIAWNDARAASDDEALAPSAWLDAARAYSQIRRNTTTPEAHARVALNAYNAWRNAVVVAVMSGHADQRFLSESGRMIRELGPLHYDEASRLYLDVVTHVRRAR